MNQNGNVRVLLQMKTLKLVGRIVLVLLMIPILLQLILTVIGIITAINQKPEAISYLIGRFVGTSLFLFLFVWLFRKLGDTRSDAQ